MNTPPLIERNNIYIYDNFHVFRRQTGRWYLETWIDNLPRASIVIDSPFGRLKNTNHKDIPYGQLIQEGGIYFGVWWQGWVMINGYIPKSAHDRPLTFYLCTNGLTLLAEEEYLVSRDAQMMCGAIHLALNPSLRTNQEPVRPGLIIPSADVIDYLTSVGKKRDILYSDYYLPEPRQR